MKRMAILVGVTMPSSSHCWWGCLHRGVGQQHWPWPFVCCTHVVSALCSKHKSGFASSVLGEWACGQAGLLWVNGHVAGECVCCNGMYMLHVDEWVHSV